MKIFAFDFE